VRLAISQQDFFFSFTRGKANQKAP